MARVALIVPSGRGLGRAGPLLTRVLRVPPPGGVAMIAASVRAAGHDVRVLDLARKARGAADVARELSTWGADAVGLSVLGPAFDEARELTDALRRWLPSALLFWGNALPSTFPGWTLDQIPTLDAVIVGEGERTAVELLETGLTAPGVATRDRPEPPPAEQIDDLDALPLPAWDLLGPRSYPASPQLLLGGRPTLGVLQSRGCPWTCSFCAQNFAWPSVRMRSIESIAEEIARNLRDYGVDSFGFYDSIFPLRREFGEELFRALDRRRLIGAVRFFTETRVDMVWPETFSWLKRAGLHLVFLGIESPDPRLLRGVDKVRGQGAGYAPRAALQALRTLNIRSYGLFVIGLPDETAADRRRLEREMLDLPLDIASVGIRTPYPGAPGSAGRTEPDPSWLRSVNWGGTPGRDPALVRSQRRLMRRFYLRPRVVLRELVRAEIPLARLGFGAATLLGARDRT